MILLTGITGNIGGATARALLARGVRFRALVRDTQKAAAWAERGVELVVGNLEDAASITRALAGIDRALLVLPNGEPQEQLELAFIRTAREAGLPWLLKLSSPEAVRGTTSPIPLAHLAAEDALKASGMKWTLLRPSFYMQNFLSNAAIIKAEGKFYYPFGDKGAAALTDSRDAGFFAAHCLATTGHENKSYDVTSPDKLSFHEIAAVFSRELGRQIDYVPQDPAAYKAYLGKFLASRWHLDAVCDIFAEVAAGYVVEPTNVFKQITGRDPVTLAQFVRDYRAVFTP